MSEKSTNCGAYGALILAEDFTDEIIDAFEVVNHIVGVEYRPLAVQKQIVAGTNYAFFCRAKVVHPDADAYMAKVTVFASLPDASGKVHYSISEIVRIYP